MAIPSPFVWGKGGKKMTPEQVEQQRALAALAQNRAGDTSPVGHWTQGAARVVDALGAGLRQSRADKAETAGMAEADAYVQGNPVLASLVGGGGYTGVEPRVMETSAAFGDAPMNFAGISNAEKLRGVDPRLGEVISEAARRAGLRVGVSEGLRDAERQRQMVAEGKSKTMNSKHLHGGAGDFHIIGDDGKPIWDFEAYRPLADEAKRVAAELGYNGFEWGGDWNTLKDGVHFQFSGGGGAAPIGQQSQPGPNVVSALAQSLSNPWVAKKYGPVIQALMGNEMKRADMQYQQQLRQQDPLYQAQLANMTAPKPVDPWAGTQVINGQVVRMGETGPEVIGDFSDPDIQPVPITPEQRAAWGIPPDDTRPYAMTPEGPKLIGGGGVTVINDMGGPELGKLSSDYGYVLDPKTGKPVIDPDTGLPTAAPVPGSPAAREIEEASRMGAEKDRQSELKMGTTLENIGLNIAELENGGWPVTGPVGVLASKMPGTAAADFAARTGQINTRAALDEVQNMRDNSPTGGAVGQLTDSEREAIGLAATSLSESVSRDEYLRAAKKFRKLMLDVAHGEGNWRLDENGRLFVGDKANSADDYAAFANDPNVQQQAEKYGVTVEEMWAIKQGLK